MKKDDRYVPVLRVYWDEMAGCNGYRHLAAQPCLIDTQMRSTSTDTIYGGLHFPGHYHETYGWMDGLTIWSQGNNDDQPRRLYGWEPSFRNVHSVELRDAQRMAKTLLRIQSGLQKLHDEWGYTDSYQEYLIRVAKVLKIKSMIFKNTAERQERSGYQYQVREVGHEAKYSLEMMLREWIDAGAAAVA